LRDLGYVEGENIAIEARWAEGSAERFPHLIAELIRLKIDVMVVGGAAGALAAKNAGITVPVVFAAVTDPLGYRQPRSAWRQYHRGSTGGRRGVQRKVGRAAQGDPPEDRKDGRPAKPNPPACRGFSQRNAGGGPGAWRKARFFEARDPSQLGGAVSRMEKEHTGAFIVTPSPLFTSQRSLIMDFVARRRWASMFFAKEFVDAGGYMSYGPSFPDSYRRAAIYVDKILKGAKPADLPVEQPTKFEFIINMKAAKQIGLTIPPSVLARADKVIK